MTYYTVIAFIRNQGGHGGPIYLPFKYHNVNNLKGLAHYLKRTYPTTAEYMNVYDQKTRKFVERLYID